MSETANVLHALIDSREREGIKTYGTTCDRSDLTARKWLHHLREEMLDGAMYVTALDRELPVMLKEAFDAGMAATHNGQCPLLAFEVVRDRLLGAKR